MCDIHHKAVGWWWWGQHWDYSEDTWQDLMPNNVANIASIFPRFSLFDGVNRISLVYDEPSEVRP